MGLLQLLDLESLSLSRLAGILSGLYLLYIVGIGIHRLYFSPYAKFPGPKLAGLTYGYMFYYDALGVKGQYIYKIQQLHEDYSTSHATPSGKPCILTLVADSPIIRISPHELHVNDPDFYDILFTGASSKRDKPPTWSHAFGGQDSMFGTIKHESHRLRRSAVAPFFSSASIRKIEPLIQDKISLLISVFRRYQSTGEILHIRPAFSALTSDVITEYFFGISENYIEAKEFNAIVLMTTDKLTDNMHVTVQWPWLPIWVNKLPDWIVGGIFGEGMATFQVLKRVCYDTFLLFI